MANDDNFVTLDCSVAMDFHMMMSCSASAHSSYETMEWHRDTSDKLNYISVNACVHVTLLNCDDGDW